ncbi:MAG: hypothetical protein HKN47_20150 [Pirellulaceae bacterium]|nr:hypothetical protein [Pirellulaceae bacterium]
MSPKHKLITTAWCSITMVATMILSHGHLILREIMTHWPEQESWEGRFETALYTQGGLVFVASFVIGGVLMIRGYFNRINDQELARKELAQREKHERAAASRHEALMKTLATSLASSSEGVNGSGGTAGKKSHASGARPR